MHTHDDRGNRFTPGGLAALASAMLGSVMLALSVAAGAEDKTEPPAREKKTERPANFVPAAADALRGDWQGSGGYVGQVLPTAGGKYQALLLKAFDTEDNVVAVLEGVPSGKGDVQFSGAGWRGVIEHGHFTGSNRDKRFDLQPVKRAPPTLGAKPPDGAVVLFGGHNLDAWAKKAGKDWLKEDGPARWKLVAGSAVEVVPESDCLITHQKFGNCKLHVEFRTLGTPTNSGVFLQDRYELNINETYGRPDQSPNAGFDNCTENAKPRVRPCRPPLDWQTFDIDFHAPQFDAGSKRIAKARASVLFNGVKIYENQELERPKGAASRLGEAPTGPLMLQEHGMPVQFRNIWLLETR